MGNDSTKLKVYKKHIQKDFLVILKGGRKFTVLKKQLGKGSSCEVRLAIDGKGKSFAAKIFEKKTLLNLKLNYEKEISLLKSLNHRHIVKIEEVAEFDEKVFIFMEYCDSGDLSTYYKNKTTSLSLKQLLKIINNILSAMNELYEKKIIHRDLKPENVLVHKDDIKLTDFAFARFVDSNYKVQELSLIGTTTHAAPQILNKDSEYSMKCDVWSLGVLFHEILYNSQHPFLEPNQINKIDDKKYIDILNKTVRQNRKHKILKEYPQRPKKLKELLENMLAYEEVDRLSFPEVYQIFQEIFSEEEAKLHELPADIKDFKKFNLESIPIYESQTISNLKVETMEKISKINEQNLEKDMPILNEADVEIEISVQEKLEGNVDFNELMEKINKNNKDAIFIITWLESRREFGHFYIDLFWMLTRATQNQLFLYESITVTFLTYILLLKTKIFFEAFLDDLQKPEGMKQFKAHFKKNLIDLSELPIYIETVTYCKSELKYTEEWLQITKMMIEDESKNCESLTKVQYCGLFFLKTKFDEFDIEKGLEKSLSWLIKETGTDFDDMDQETRALFIKIIALNELEKLNVFPSDMDDIGKIPNLLAFIEKIANQDSYAISKNLSFIRKLDKNKV